MYVDSNSKYEKISNLEMFRNFIRQKSNTQFHTIEEK